MVLLLLTQFASGLCWIIYGSFFEWYWHRYWMHTPRPPREAFRGHTIVHHGLYKGDESYFVPEGQHPKHILLKPYALPAMLVAHLPVFYLIERLIPNTMIGGLTASVLYFATYEYTHWNMHVPRNHFIERFGWFQFVRRHHHLHHRYHQKNFCVLFPLADWVLGTAATEESMARRKAERERAIANGEAYAERKRRSRGSRVREREQRAAASPSRSYPFLLIETLRQRHRTREQRRWKQARHTFMDVVKGRRAQ